MSAIKKRGRWYFRKRLKGHGRIFVTPADYGLPNTKVGAEEAGRRRITELLDGHIVHRDIKPEKMIQTLAEFEPVFMEHSDGKNEYSTTKAKRQILRDHIIPALGSLPLNHVDFAAIDDFKNQLTKTLGDKTINNILTVLRRLLVLAFKRGQITAVPEIEWIPLEPTAFDFLDFEEADRLIDAAEDEWRAMITIAIRCGLRQGELLGLRWEHVDLKLNRIVVRQSIVRGRVKGTKSRRIRTVDLGADVAAELARHRHLRGPYVFCDHDGHHLTPGECKHPLYRACAHAKVRRIGWHVLRHTFCSHLAMLGVAPQVIQKLAGHATLAMTERYMHLSPNVTVDAVRKLDRGARLVPSAGRTRASGRDRT